MTEDARTAFRRLVDSVADRYRARGYDVTVEPSGPSVPSFMQGFRPDLIARKGAEGVVVEVKLGTKTSAVERYQRLAELVQGQPGWRFDLLVVEPEQAHELTVDAPLPSESEIRERLRRAKELETSGALDAAFLVLWIAAEAVMRLIAHRASLPLERMPTSALVRDLYSAGEIDRRDYEVALGLLTARSGIVHGFATDISEEQLDKLRALVERLFAELGKRPA